MSIEINSNCIINEIDNIDHSSQRDINDIIDPYQSHDSFAKNNNVDVKSSSNNHYELNNSLTNSMNKNKTILRENSYIAFKKNTNLNDEYELGKSQVTIGNSKSNVVKTEIKTEDFKKENITEAIKHLKDEKNHILKDESHLCSIIPVSKESDKKNSEVDKIEQKVETENHIHFNNNTEYNNQKTVNSNYNNEKKFSISENDKKKIYTTIKTYNSEFNVPNCPKISKAESIKDSLNVTIKNSNNNFDHIYNKDTSKNLSKKLTYNNNIKDMSIKESNEDLSESMKKQNDLRKFSNDLNEGLVNNVLNQNDKNRKINIKEKINDENDESCSSNATIPMNIHSEYYTEGRTKKKLEHLKPNIPPMKNQEIKGKPIIINNIHINNISFPSQNNLFSEKRKISLEEILTQAIIKSQKTNIDISNKNESEINLDSLNKLNNEIQDIQFSTDPKTKEKIYIVESNGKKYHIIMHPNFNIEEIYSCQINKTDTNTNNANVNKDTINHKFKSILKKDSLTISNKRISSNNIKFPFRICFLCDQFHIREATFTSDRCDHSFCYKCGKTFFEEKIENGNIDFFGKPYSYLKNKELNSLNSIEKENNNNNINAQTHSRNNFSLEKENASNYTNTKNINEQLNSKENQNLNKEIVCLEKDHFYCPVFKCEGIIHTDIIQQIIGNQFYNSYKEKLECLSKKIKNNEERNLESNIVAKPNMFQIHSERSNKGNKKKQTFEELRFTHSLQEYKLITKKHILHLEDSNSVLQKISKEKNLFCTKCNLPALYGKTGNSYVKCLNCFQSICKFCFKPLTSDHFEITSLTNYCRVYFRKKLHKEKEEKGRCFIAVFNFLLVLVSIIFTLIGSVYTVSDFIERSFYIPEDYILSLQKHERVKNIGNYEVMRFKGFRMRKKNVMLYVKDRNFLSLLKYIVYVFCKFFGCLICFLITWMLLMIVPFLVILGLMV